MSRPFASLRLLGIALLASLITAGSASAQTTYTWNGGGADANWSTPENWTASAGVPPPTSDLTNTLLVLTGNTQLANTLNFDLSANSLTFDAGAGAFTVGGTNTLTLGTGGITVLGASNQIFNAPITLGAAQGWTNNGAGLFTVGGVVTTGGNLLTIDGSGNTTMTADISGGGGLTKVGTGTLTLTGNKTYTGVTNVNAGTLVFTGTASLGATGAGNDTVVASGASLTIGNNTISPAELLTLNGTGTANEGALRKIGTTNSNWTAAITIASASRINNDSSGLLTLSGAIGVGSNTLRVGGTGNTTISGQITLATTGTFIHDSPSTVTITNNANGGASGTFLGSIQVTNGGVLSFAGTGGAHLGTTGASGTIFLDNGTLWNTITGNAGTFVTTNRNIVLGAGGGTLQWNDTGLTSGSPNIIIIQNTAPGTTIQGTQGGALNKTGGGIIALAQPATYDGPTNVLAGALRVRNNNVFPIATTLTVASGATFDVNNLNQQVGSLAGAGDVNISGGLFTVGNATSTTFTGRFTEAAYAGNGGIGGRVTKVGAGTLTVGSNNFYSGATTISNGVLSVSSLNNGGVSGFTITTTAGSTSATVSDATGLAVGMTIVNRNLVLGTTITNIAGTTITLSSPANLAVTANAAAAGFPSGIGISTSAAGNLVLNGGTLQYTGAATSTNRLFTLNTAGGAIDASGTGALTLAATGTVGGSGTRTLTLTGTNTGANTFTPVLDGTSTSLVKSGVGQWVLNGLNTYAGTTTISGGTLTAGAANTLPSATAVTVGATGILHLNNLSQTIASLAGSGTVLFGSGSPNTATLTVGGDNSSTTFSGVIGSAVPAEHVGILTKVGSGTLTLTGNNTYDGQTNVNAGTLLVNGQSGTNSGTGLSTVIVNSGGTIGGTGRTNAITFNVNTGGTVRGGDANMAGTLTVNGLLSLGDNAIIGVRVNDASPGAAAAGSGGSTDGTIPNPTSNNFIHVTNGDLSWDPTKVVFTIDGTGSPFVVGQTYSYQIGQIDLKDLSTLNISSITSPSQFITTGFNDPTNFTITGGPGTGGQVYLNISPVPEPATVLGLAAGALSLGGLIRRRVARRA